MKATKKIVGAAVALVAAVALSAGSTFAWFTSNSDVKVTSIDANVVTYGGDLQIGLVEYGTGKTLAPATDSETGTVSSYSSTIDGATIKGKLAESFKLDAVTSTDGKTMKDVADANASANGANGTYIQFTVSLRSTTKMNIYLAKDTKLTSTDAAAATSIQAWATIPANTYGKNQDTEWTTADSITAKAQAASRLSFETTADSGSTVKVWAPYESTTNGGALEDTAIEALTNVADYGYYKGNLASDYAKATGKSNLVVDDTHPLPVYTATTKISPATGKVVATGKGSGTSGAAGDGEVLESGATASSLLTLEPGVAKTVTIRMWIEGRDGDCINSIFGQNVAFTVAFCGVDVPATPATPAPSEG